MTALKLLPVALRLLESELGTSAQWEPEYDEDELTGYVWCGDETMVMRCVESSGDAPIFAALRNMLPALVEMAADWATSRTRRSAPSYALADAAEALAQRILDTLPTEIVQAARDEVQRGKK